MSKQRRSDEKTLTEEMVLLTERCTGRNCDRVRYYSERIDDDANTHWHIKRGFALQPVSALADLAAARAENEAVKHETKIAAVEALKAVARREHDSADIAPFVFIDEIDAALAEPSQRDGEAAGETHQTCQHGKSMPHYVGRSVVLCSGPRGPRRAADEEPGL